MISFVHCGDLHLGIMPEKNQTRYNDFFSAFASCIDYAINKRVDFIIVAGDMFHQKVINSKTLSKTCEILRKAQAKKIDVLVIEGNHDRAFYVDEESWLAYLDKEGLINLLSINNDAGKLSINKDYEKDTYRVIGVGYLGGATEKYIDAIKDILPNDGKINILVMHAAVDRMLNQNMGDVSSEEISKLKDRCTYLALGHVHSKYECLDFIYNPGSLENLRTKDALSGSKGFYYVQINEETKERDIEYIDSDKRKIRYKKLDCTNLSNPDEVINNIKQLSSEWKDINEGDIIYLGINGKTLFNPLLIDDKQIKQFLVDTFKPLYVEISNNINDLNPLENVSEGVNLDAIVENAIEAQIKYSYPDITNPQNDAKSMKELASLLENGTIEKDIFDLLMRKEDL